MTLRLTADGGLAFAPAMPPPAPLPPLVIPLGRAADALELLAEDRRAILACERSDEACDCGIDAAGGLVDHAHEAHRALVALLTVVETDDDFGAVLAMINATPLRATADVLAAWVTALRGRAADLLDANEAPQCAEVTRG